jgi:hypothetical protein
MFWEFFTFELKLRAKSISTYVYFGIWTLFSFFCVASESFGPVGAANGKVLLNGPYANTYNDVGASLFGVIIVAAIFGPAILRDFHRDTYQMVFTKPVSKAAYLGGRWAGSFVTAVFVFAGMMVGTFIGTFAPWADHVRIGPNHLWWYLQPFLSVNVISIFFLGSFFFAVAALTRRIVVVYLQGVAFFIVYLIGQSVYFSGRSLEHFWSGIVDPVGWVLVDNVTRYWSVLEKNMLLLPWDMSGYSPGVFLYNRILWTALGALSLLATWAAFPMSVEALTRRSQSLRAARARAAEVEDQKELRPVPALAALSSPVERVFDATTSFRQYITLSRLRTRAILREVPFWGIAGLLLVFALNSGHYAGRVGGQDVWPVTYLMLQSVEGGAALFFYIVATLYAGELIWRERDTHFDGIHDALPLRESIDWLSKFTALTAIELLLLTLTMVAGIVMQIQAGYYHFELTQYLKELYLVTFPGIVSFVLFAMFVQTMVSNKFLGHAIVIGVFAMQGILYNFGWENSLYLPGAAPSYTYSDMNGYGHFVWPQFWADAYWLSIFAVLGVASIAFARRGAEDSLAARTRAARVRAIRLAPAGALLVLFALGSGGWFYYNAHVQNEFLSTPDQRHIQAGYERDFKKYEFLPQPKTTAVDATIDIHPDRRGFDGTGRYTLQNKSAAPISEIHITDWHQTVSNVKFDRAFHLVSQAPRNVYSRYRLDQPLAPGEVTTLTFSLSHAAHGFRDGHEEAQFALNGTFFDAEFFPAIGYSSNNELDDPRRRREEHLGPLVEMAARGDTARERLNLFTPNSDWITYHTVVSTSSDQIAIAPGYLQRQWEKDGRRYYEYSMGSTHILDFYAYLSGRYIVRRETYTGASGPVNLEVYYDTAHPYDVDQMLASTRAGLDYYQSRFSPFQFSQFRIMEFPRYRGFAQSFPNTVPFSEAIGFIARMKKPTDVDLTYFVTAHELGHQWWGHQLIGGDVEGSNMMSETLAQYSAYMVMQQKYGKDYMRIVLRHFLDQYLRGRSGETRHEPPLSRVQREGYVWYDKGGQIMYTLADYIGEDKVNLALRNFLMQYRYANATNQVDVSDSTRGARAVDQRYPDTRLLVDALRAQTPADLQYLIDDGFERVVLYDNKALSATSRRLPNGKYEVTLEVQARKVQVDSAGAESPMPMADYIDIGVFKGTSDEPHPLYMNRVKFTQERQKFTVVVDERPTRAGIDPYNKLIDRNGEDNVLNVTNQ